MIALKKFFVCISVLCIVLVGCGQMEDENATPDVTQDFQTSCDAIEGTEDETEENTEKSERYTSIVPVVKLFRELEVKSEEIQWQQPMLIEDKAAFDSYWTEVTEQFYGGKNDLDASDFNEQATKYSKTWFEENRLIVLTLKHPNWDYCHEVRLVKDNERDRLNIEISAQRPEQEMYPSEAYWIMLLEVNRAALGEVNELDLTVTESVDQAKSVIPTTVRILEETAKETYFVPFIVRNEQELNETCRFLFATSDTANKEEWFTEEFSGYQGSWFADNALILIPVIDGSIGYHYDARLIRNEKDQSISVDIIRWVREDAVRFSAFHAQLIVIEVESAELGQISELKRDIVHVVLPAVTETVIELQANQVVGIPEYPVSTEIREQALEGNAPGFIIGSRAELDAFCQSEIKRLEDGGNSRAEHYIREQTFDDHLATCDEAWFEDQVLVGLYYWASDIAYEGQFRAEKIELIDGVMTADIVHGRWAGGSTAEMVYLIIMEMDKASLEGVETIRLGMVTEEFLKSE